MIHFVYKFWIILINFFRFLNNLINIHTRILLLKSIFHIFFFNIYTWQLITQWNPPSSPIMWSCKQFTLPSPRSNSFNQLINLIRFPTSLSYFSHQNITINISIDSTNITFDTHQTMFFTMIQPMPCPTSPNDSPFLISLDPHQLFYLSVPPLPQTVSSQFQCSHSHP